MNYETSIILLLLVVFCMSCKENKIHEVQRFSLSPKIISEELMTMLPGELIVSDHYLSWIDPLQSPQFIHTLNKATGKELGVFLMRGNGPDEMISPNVSLFNGDNLYTHDSNTNKQFFLSIDSVLQGKRSITVRTNIDFQQATRIIPLRTDEWIVFDPTQDMPFKYVKSESEYLFGTRPLKKTIENGFNLYQGNVKYNNSNGFLVYSTYRFPYFAVYKNDYEGFKLSGELQRNSDDFKIVGRNLEYTNTEKGARDMALTADYIVTIERDRAIDDMNEDFVGRDVSKLPHTVFVYDYGLNLMKIIDIGMPLIRLDSESENNTVYAIGIRDYYQIVKFEL